MKKKGWSTFSFLVFLLSSLIPNSCGICPEQCTCDDDSLSANCSLSNLKVIPNFLNPSIRSLKFRGNKIHNLEGVLMFYTSLIELDLSSNEFKHLGRDQFGSQLELHKLNVSDNFISTLHENAFKGPTNLQTLDLSHNALSQLEDRTFHGLVSLVELDLQHNKITNISADAFNGLSRLRILNLGHNRLDTLDPLWVSRLKNLRFFYLSDNRLMDLPADAFKPLTALRVIALARNALRSPLTHLAFRGTRQVDTLDLSGNHFEVVPKEALAEMPQLRELDLSGNQLISIEKEAFNNLHLLQLLRLSNMSSLEKVNGLAFVDNAKLQELYLEHDQGLDPLPWGIFASNSQLKVLSFKGNSWISLSPLQLPRHSLDELHLSGLPLHCNCSIVWLWELYHQNTTTTLSSKKVKLDSVHCYSVTSSSDGQKLTGEAGDPLMKMARSQLICPDWSGVLLIVSISIIVTVFILVLAAIIVYNCRRKLKYKKRNYGDASCLQLQDDTMIYKTSLRATYTMPTSTDNINYKPVSATSEYSPEPFYEVPKFSNKDDDPKSSDTTSSKYSSTGLIGSELWEPSATVTEYNSNLATTNALPAHHGYANPSSNIQRMAMVLAAQGSPMSTSTALSATGSSSNASSTASSDSNRQFYYSPGRYQSQILPMHHFNNSHQQQPNSKKLGGHQQQTSNTLFRYQTNSSPPPPAPTSSSGRPDGYSRTMLNPYADGMASNNPRYSNSPVRKNNFLPNNSLSVTSQGSNKTGSLRNKSKGARNLYV